MFAAPRRSSFIVPFASVVPFIRIETVRRKRPAEDALKGWLLVLRQLAQGGRTDGAEPPWTRQTEVEARCCDL